jgi:hypothetical protein
MPRRFGSVKGGASGAVARSIAVDLGGDVGGYAMISADTGVFERLVRVFEKIAACCFHVPGLLG